MQHACTPSICMYSNCTYSICVPGICTTTQVQDEPWSSYWGRACVRLCRAFAHAPFSFTVPRIRARPLPCPEPKGQSPSTPAASHVLDPPHTPFTLRSVVSWLWTLSASSTTTMSACSRVGGHAGRSRGRVRGRGGGVVEGACADRQKLQALPGENTDRHQKQALMCE